MNLIFHTNVLTANFLQNYNYTRYLLTFQCFININIITFVKIYTGWAKKPGLFVDEL